MSDITIIPIEASGIPVWGPMRSAFYGSQTDAENRQEMEMILASDHHGAFFAVDSANRPIGLLELSLRNIVDGCTTSPVGYIEGVYLKPEARGKGFGRQLIAFAENWARERGCTELASDSLVENTEAQAFHRAVGFEETGRIVQFRKDI